MSLFTQREIDAIRSNPELARAIIKAEITARAKHLQGLLAKQNKFNTLSEALEAEGIAHMWDGRPIAYDQTVSRTYNDGTRYGHFVSIYRDERGLYERPIHYSRN